MCYNSIGDSMKDRNVGGIFYKIEVYDKDGKLIEEKSGKGDSILLNWIYLFYSIRNGDNYIPTTTDGSTPTISQIVFTNCSMLAPAGNDDYGIQVGTGTTSVDITDSKLESQITHGTGSGQLSYGETSEFNEEAGNTVRRGLQRSFDNNSGADITINEIGMVAKINDGTNDYYVMIARDVISATTVPNGGRVTITYWFEWNP